MEEYYVVYVCLWQRQPIEFLQQDVKDLTTSGVRISDNMGDDTVKVVWCNMSEMVQTLLVRRNLLWKRMTVRQCLHTRSTRQAKYYKAPLSLSQYQEQNLGESKTTLQASGTMSLVTARQKQEKLSFLKREHKEQHIQQTTSVVRNSPNWCTMLSKMDYICNLGGGGFSIQELTEAIKYGGGGKRS